MPIGTGLNKCMDPTMGPDPYSCVSTRDKSRCLGIPYPTDYEQARRLVDELDHALFEAHKGAPYMSQAYGAPQHVSVRCVLEKEREPVKTLPYCAPLDNKKKLLLVG